MKLILIATALAVSPAIALPALAQALDQSTPSTGPAAREARQSRTNNAASQLGGGMQPSTPALEGTPQPGVQPVFRQAPPPSEAFPPPAPLDSYPVCKRGQYDKCVQAGEARRAQSRRPRRR